MGRTFKLHSIARARAYRGRSASLGKCPPCVRPRKHLKRLGENICPSTAKPTYGLTSDRQASRQVRSTLRLFARRIDFLLFVFVHFFDSRILVALAGCLSSCGWRAGVRNRCLPPAASPRVALLWRVAGLFGRPPAERSKEARLRLTPRVSSLLCSSCPTSKKTERSNSS